MSGARTMFGSLAVRNYRLFAGGQAVSLVGTWMQRVAQDWLVLELSGDSGTALGVVTGLQFLPLLLFGLYGGVLADRYDKRRLLTGAQVSMGLLALALGVLDVTGTATLGAVYALALLLGLASAVDVPVRQSFVGEIVGRDHVANAISLNSATFNGARVVGPALAGVLVSTVGTGPVFLLNAASYAAVVGGLLAMRTDELRRADPVPRARGQLVEGLRYVRGRPDLLLPMLLVFVIGTFGLNFQITLALVAKEVFGRGATAYGLLSSMIALGSLAGALLATRRAGRPRLRVLVGSALAFGVLEVATGFMPTYGLFAVLLVPTGAAVLLFTTAANASVQLGSEPSLRGRVMSLYVLVFLGGTPIGGPLIGALADAFGARSSLVVGGLVSVAATLAVAGALGRGRHLRVVAHQRPRPHVHVRADGTDGWRLPARPAADRRAG